MHLKHISRSWKKNLFRNMYDEHPEFRKKRKEEERKKKKHKRSRSRSRDRKKKRKHHSRSRDKKKKSYSSSRSKGGDDRPREMNSMERRAMIAQWNKEEENK
mmetsp:Transcript_93358/g.140097  ORF Transcript_93358/g.140097 Transcript_93358/m.140097 type:complete len:102 (+) Transcript_93358:200-505(+)